MSEDRPRTADEGPRRGEVWLATLDPTRGREQRGTRPVLVLSADLFNEGPAELAIVLPLTSRDRGIPNHVPVRPPEAGVDRPSYVLCEAIRSLSLKRFHKRWGRVGEDTLARVETVTRILLGL